MTDALAAIAIGYLLGSLPFGYWAGRLRGIDLRLAGSGNTGATNVMRVLGLKVGVPVMALDIAKGAAAVVVARELSSNDIVPVLAAAAAVTGHMYPFLLGFRGGKGVATGAGTMIALVPWIGIAAFFLWLGLSLATRYVSIGSVVTAVAYPHDVYRDRPAVGGVPLHARRGGLGDLAPPREHRPPACRHREPHQPARGLRRPDLLGG